MTKEKELYVGEYKEKHLGFQISKDGLYARHPIGGKKNWKMINWEIYRHYTMKPFVVGLMFIYYKKSYDPKMSSILNRSEPLREND